MKQKKLLSCYAICMLFMSVILMWRASSGYVFAYEYNSMNGKENADGEIYMNLSLIHIYHILVLDDGKLVGDAPHAALLQSCEVYKEICLSQLSKEEVEKTL